MRKLPYTSIPIKDLKGEDILKAKLLAFSEYTNDTELLNDLWVDLVIDYGNLKIQSAINKMNSWNATVSSMTSQKMNRE